MIGLDIATRLWRVAIIPAYPSARPLCAVLGYFLIMAMTSDSDVSPEVMRTYYRRLYPFDALFRWLNHAHSPTKSFTHREFAFTLQGDVYLRYQSFQTAEDLKKQACSLNPTRFEIGPVYSAKARLLVHQHRCDAADKDFRAHPLA